MGVAPAERRFVNHSAIDKAHTIGNKEVNFAGDLQDNDFKKVYAVASPCKSDNSDAKGIQRVIKNLQNAISTIKRFSNINSAVDALINEDVEPGKTIKKIVSIATTDIAGYVKNIIGRVRGWVLNQVQNNVKKVLPFLFPGEMPSFLDKLGKGINGLSCAFAKILRALAKTVGSLLLGLIDKYINGPMCIVENFIADLLKSITDPISAAIGTINAFLGSAVGAITNLADSLFNAIDFITGILNFFKCDDDKACPTQNEISRSGDASETSANTGDPVEATSQPGLLGSGKGVGTSQTPATLDANTSFKPKELDFGTTEQAQQLLDRGEFLF
jgi:phage-related protein